MSEATVRVPATSANLGPGFDCLALALDLWNEVSFCLEGSSTLIQNQGEGASFLPADRRSLVLQAFMSLYQAAGERPPAGLMITANNHIPVGCGLGSSAAAILAGFLGANHLLGSPFPPNQILAMANRVEGHPDNLTAALYGGLTAAIALENSLASLHYDLPSMQVVLVIPEFRLSTRAARAALPSQVPINDAVFNLSHTVFVLDALRRGDLDLLGQVMADRLHQNQRFALIPGAAAAAQAALQAGAAATGLSGAGPGMIAFAHENHTGIAAAMQHAFQNAGLSSRWMILNSSLLGAQVQGE